jgi:two-component system phosphate regulon response regulator PhoB
MDSYSHCASEETLRFADLVMDIPAYKVRRNGRPVTLTALEFRLLKHFLEHPGRVFTRSQLLGQVWGEDRHVDPRSVDTHIRRLRRALGTPGGGALIRTVRTVGYALDQDAR